MKLLVGCVFALIASAPLVLGKTSGGVTSEPGSRVKIEWSSPYNLAPPAGWVPVHVRIDNGSGKSGVWKIEANNRSLGSSERISIHEMPVPAGSTREFDLMIPVGNGNRGDISLEMDGPGLLRGFLNLAGNYDGSTRPKEWQWFLMSSTLAKVHWDPLAKLIDARWSGAKPPGSQFDTTEAPADRRAYFGASLVWMTMSEWRGVSPGVRDALLGWVASGGRLYLDGADESSLGAIPGAGTPPEPVAADTSVATFQRRLGAGKVLAIPDAVLAADLGRVLLDIAPKDQLSLPEQIEAYSRQDPLAQKFPDAPLRSGFVVALLFLFAAIAAPVNLFVFAPAHRRTRLFWTTPLISIGSTAVLFLVIWIQDGFGGAGGRRVFVQIVPERNEMIISQVQFVRTGMLVSPRFTMDEDAWITPLALGYDRATAVQNPRGKWFSAGDRLWGNWFRSRSRHFHYLHAVEPTRARVELVDAPDQFPQVISTIPVELGPFFYTDPQGRTWTAPTVRTGERTLLSAGIRDAKMEAMAQIAAGRGTAFAPLAGAGLDQPGTFIAIGKDARDALPTLSSIRWQDAVVYHGPCIAREPQ
jgi:hypothetical protein